MLASALLHAPFYFYVSYAMIRYLFHDDRVTRDELFATGAAFTVVAWGFAYVYAGGQVVWPGSFVGAGGEIERSWFELLFLSFTTLTSVGLSDVVPVLAHARSLVMVEMVAGVFYVALVVARLVSLAVVRHRPDDLTQPVILTLHRREDQCDRADPGPGAAPDHRPTAPR